jgi:hypothetical protein
VRSWKQITKFKPSGSVAVKVAAAPAMRPIPPGSNMEPTIEAAAANSEFDLEGLIRDERGVRLAPEGDD